MKLKKIISLILLALTACMLCAFAGCKKTQEKETLPTAVFELEGGSYKNSSYAIKYGYYLSEGQETYIVNPDDVSQKDAVTRQGYLLVGWFKTKTVEGDSVSYSDPWDFTTDKMGYEGITLYACWEKAIKYTYVIGYIDDAGEFQKVRSTSVYTVEKGDKLDDYSDYANKRSGYTALPESYDEVSKKWIPAYYDIDGNKWNPDFTHPGDDENPEVKVVVKYIQGKDVAFVSTKEELVKAQSGNFYLLNDIDMEGETLMFTSKGMARDKFIYGNGHTISNFTLSYEIDKDSLAPSFDEGTPFTLYVALFGELQDSVIKDVTFENVTIDLGTKNSSTKGVYFAPIAVYAVDSVVENVTATINLNYNEDSFFEGFDINENLKKETQNAYLGEENSTFENVTVTVTENGAN